MYSKDSSDKIIIKLLDVPKRLLDFRREREVDSLIDECRRTFKLHGEKDVDFSLIDDL